MRLRRRIDLLTTQRDEAREKIVPHECPCCGFVEERFWREVAG